MPLSCCLRIQCVNVDSSVWICLNPMIIGIWEIQIWLLIKSSYCCGTKFFSVYIFITCLCLWIYIVISKLNRWENLYSNLHKLVHQKCQNYLMLLRVALQINGLHPTFYPEENQCPIVRIPWYIIIIPFRNDYIFYSICRNSMWIQNFVSLRFNHIFHLLTNLPLLDSDIIRCYVGRLNKKFPCLLISLLVDDLEKDYLLLDLPLL